MDRDMNILYILGVPLGYVMEWIYNLIPNYGWDIIIFTIVIRLISIPLQLNQQKSMAKMSRFPADDRRHPEKYKDKPEKQQEELLKLQQEYGYKPPPAVCPCWSTSSSCSASSRSCTARCSASSTSVPTPSPPQAMP